MTVYKKNYVLTHSDIKKNATCFDSFGLEKTLPVLTCFDKKFKLEWKALKYWNFFCKWDDNESLQRLESLEGLEVLESHEILESLEILESIKVMSWDTETLKVKIFLQDLRNVFQKPFILKIWEAPH